MGLPGYPEDDLQRLDIQTSSDQERHELCVRRLNLAQALRVTDVRYPELRASAIAHLVAATVLSADLLHRHPVSASFRSPMIC